VFESLRGRAPTCRARIRASLTIMPASAHCAYYGISSSSPTPPIFNCQNRGIVVGLGPIYGHMGRGNLQCSSQVMTRPARSTTRPMQSVCSCSAWNPWPLCLVRCSFPPCMQGRPLVLTRRPAGRGTCYDNREPKRQSSPYASCRSSSIWDWIDTPSKVQILKKKNCMDM